MIYVAYILLAILVVGLSIRLSYYVDLIDKTTDLSGAFIGGVMLAAVTSLPELFTSLSATAFLGKPELVLGNILGSNLFNITVLAVIILVMSQGFHKAYIAKSHGIVAKWLIVIYALLTAPVIFGKDINIVGVSVVSVAIMLIYVGCIKKMAGDTSEQEDDEDEVHTNLTTKQLFIRFGILSILLVAASIGITFVTDRIAVELNLGMTLAGALFLGIATSLPEVTSSISLAKMGNFNATMGNILGSNLFNLFILVLADVLYRAGSVYTSDIQSCNLVFFGMISTVMITMIVTLKNKQKQINDKLKKTFYIGGSIIAILGYIFFLTLSN
ncbi:MAG: sodium:calcium antiporter [Cellulosilyticaceae bacterium]